MKKAIAIAVILVIAVVAALPFASGLIMEKTVRRAVDALNTMNASTGGGYSLTIIDYDRRYGTSDITWKINLGALKTICPIEEIIFRDHAEHGLAGVVSTTRLNSNPWYAYFVAENLLGRDPIRMTTHYGLSGSIENRFDLDAFMIPVGEETIDIKAGSIVTTTDRTFEKFVSAGTWRGLSAGDRLSIGPLTMDSDMTRLSPFIWDGVVNLALTGMQARQGKNHLQIESIEGTYAISCTEDRKQVSAEARLSIEGMRTPKRNVDNASVHVAVKGLDAAGYASFMRLTTQNKAHTLGTPTARDEGLRVTPASMRHNMPTLGLKMLAAGEQLLKEGLEVRISDLRVALDDGSIEGGASVRLLQDISFLQFAPVINRPGLLLDIFHLESDISLPAALAGDSPRLTVPLYPGMQTGLFVHQPTGLVHQAETVGGRLMLNGKEVFLAK